MTKEKLSFGEIRVRTTFNPDNNDTVSLLKNKTAELINICETLKNSDARLASLAQTAYEEAAMWAVKAATTIIPANGEEKTETTSEAQTETTTEQDAGEDAEDTANRNWK